MQTFYRARRALAAYSNKKQAKILQGFFKTGPGEYGQGDIFLGVKVPYARKVAAQFTNLPLSEVARLLKSPFHEERLLALLILIKKFSPSDEKLRNRIFRFYLSHTRYINNWDLVDLSSSNIVGAFLWDKSRQPLYRLAKSGSLWERRIAIIATFYFIRQGEFKETLKIAGILMSDKEDLIHKAVGWMLREVGKRSLRAEEAFLRRHHSHMPRTMLRYAIERFSLQRKKAYMTATSV